MTQVVDSALSELCNMTPPPFPHAESTQTSSVECENYQFVKQTQYLSRFYKSFFSFRSSTFSLVLEGGLVCPLNMADMVTRIVRYLFFGFYFFIALALKLILLVGNMAVNSV